MVPPSTQTQVYVLQAPELGWDQALVAEAKNTKKHEQK